LNQPAPTLIQAVELRHLAPLLELFERSHAPCACQYYAFEGDHRAWQDRCANRQGENREALARELEAGQLLGFVALQGTRVVGWLRLAEPGQMMKLYQGRFYRGLPCFAGPRAGILSVACFLVDPSLRRRGVARNLLTFAADSCRRAGYQSVEAFPRGASDVSDGEQWTGPLSLFRELGFVVVHDFGPYPVLRLEFAGP
jgi:GNAT superfamily N-acetyltransferase